MSSTWAIRTDVMGMVDAGPLLCHRPESVDHSPDSRPIEDCVNCLLREYESCQGEGNKRRILKRGIVIGYIEIVDRLPTIDES
jgi:hypothetical protein